MIQEWIIIIIIAGALLWQGYVLIKKQRKMKADLDKMTDDWDRNIEFSGHTGVGVSLKKKNYPNQELKDDFRESSGEDK